MPITSQVAAVYTLTALQWDAVSSTLVATFAVTINGAPSDPLRVEFGTSEVGALLATVPAGGAALGPALTIAIYNAAVTKGAIAGTVS
jgi:hypothetical protein